MGATSGSHPSRTLVPSIAISLLLMQSGGTAAQVSEPAPVLEMEEASSIVLPDSIQVSGLTATGVGTYLIWSPGQRAVFHVERTRIHALGSNFLVRPIGAALVGRDSVVEVVDAGRKSIVQLSLSGRLLNERQLDLPVIMEEAARSGTGWFIGGWNAPGDLEVFFLDASGKPRRVHRIAREESGTGGRTAAHISAVDNDLTITLLRPPFRVVRVNSSGSVLQIFQPQLPDPIQQEVQPLDRLWMSLPVVGLRGGYLQTLSHLKSDRRLLIVYGADGAVLRHNAIEIPLGFISGVPNDSLLIASRVMGATEIVAYRWRWSNTTPMQR